MILLQEQADHKTKEYSVTIDTFWTILFNTLSNTLLLTFDLPSQPLFLK